MHCDCLANIGSQIARGDGHADDPLDRKTGSMLHPPYACLLQQACFIDGRWRNGGGDRIVVRNPSTGDVAGSAPRATRAETQIAREETSGPVASVFRFKTEEEAVALANDTEFGLASYFFTQNFARLWRFGDALDFGVIGVNTGALSCEGAPFGGVKASGIGREGSRHGIEEFTEINYLCVGDIE